MKKYKVTVCIPDYSSYTKVAYVGTDREVALEIAKSYARAGKMVWFEEL